MDKAVKSVSSKTKLVEVQEKDTGILIVSMAKPPVNSLNIELLTELTTILNEAKNEKIKGIILTSSLPTVFSAGLDIMEIFKPDATRLTQLWIALQDFWLTLYGLEKPIVAAINGSSPAAGCFTAISCDYRVMVDGKHTIGLNATNLGIVVPKWFRDAYISIIGYRKAELALLRGSLFTPQEALNIGLVDELAANKAEAISKCEKFIDSLHKVSVEAVILTKLEMRRNAITWLKNNRKEDIEAFVDFVQSQKVQVPLENYIQSLKKK